MLKQAFILALFLLLTAFVFSQGAFTIAHKNKTKVNFKLVNNLIVIPVQVNGVELSFLLDTGVSKPILFNVLDVDSLQVNQVERIFLRGLGGNQQVEAIKSKRNKIKVGAAQNFNQDIYLVNDPSIDFTPRLGVNIHGIIGYDLFKDFVVEINYSAQYLKLYKPEAYKAKSCKKCKTFNLSFHNNKPYVHGQVILNAMQVPVKLLIDTGSSDALWLFQDKAFNLYPPKDKFFNDFLGKGLSGTIHGKRTKIEAFRLKHFELEGVNVAFPDSLAIVHAKKIEDRNGSICGEILKRFNIVFNYQKAQVTLKRNKNFKNPFYYNKSGLVLVHDGLRIVKEKDQSKVLGAYKKSHDNDDKVVFDFSVNYHYALKPAYKIAEVVKGSPGDKAGLMTNDLLLYINGKGVHDMSLQEAIHHFYDKDHKQIKLVIERQGVQKTFRFKLESLLK